MDNQDYQDALEAIKFQLQDGRQRTLEELRKSDPEIIKANIRYGESLNSLAVNYQPLRRGPVTDEAYAYQRALIESNRDDVENKRIRPSFIKAREKMLSDSFGGDKALVGKALKDLEKEESLQWLRDPENEEAKGKGPQNNKGEGKEESTEKPQKSNQPNITARFDDVAKKDYQKTHSKFNRSAKTSEPEHLKGYPDTAPPEGKKVKGDIDLTKEYNAGEEFPGFDDFSPGESSVEPTRNGPDVDIGDQD